MQRSLSKRRCRSSAESLPSFPNLSAMGLAEFAEFAEVPEVDGFADLLLLPLLLLLLLVEPLDLFFELEEPLLDLLLDLFLFEFVLLSDFCGVLRSLQVFSRRRSQ